MYVFESDYGIIINPMNQILICKQICLKITVLVEKKRRHKQVEHE